MTSIDPVLAHVFDCVKAAIEKKANNPVVLSVESLTSYTDYFLIVSATSDRRVRTIADAIREKMAEEKIKPLGVEGMKEGRWVLLDFGPWVVHIFYEEQRENYNLEGLWADAQRIGIPEEYTTVEAGVEA